MIPRWIASNIERQSVESKYLHLSREHKKPKFLALSPKRSKLGKRQVGRKWWRTGQSGIWNERLGRFPASKQLRFAGNPAPLLYCTYCSTCNEILIFFVAYSTAVRYCGNIMAAEYATRPSCVTSISEFLA